MIAKDCLEDWQHAEGTIAEADILMKISHQNIVKVRILFLQYIPLYLLVQVQELFQNDNYYQMIMERCPGVTLFDLIELNHHIEENVARVIYKQVLREKMMIICTYA